MSDPIWQRAEIDSPCVKVCVIHPQARICVGCYRTGDEIAAWSRMTPEARRSAMAELPTRKPLWPSDVAGAWGGWANELLWKIAKSFAAGFGQGELHQILNP